MYLKEKTGYNIYQKQIEEKDRIRLGRNTT